MEFSCWGVVKHSFIWTETKLITYLEESVPIDHTSPSSENWEFKTSLISKINIHIIQQILRFRISLFLIKYLK